MKITIKPNGLAIFDGVAMRHGKAVMVILIIYFISNKVNKKWQRKITEEKNSGELKIGDKIIYKYHVDIDSDEVNIYHHNGNLINDYLIKIEMRD